MDSRVRTLAFAVLLIGISSLVLFQSFQTSVALVVQGAIAPISSELIPLQNANTTISSQSFAANTTSSSNSTTLNSTVAQPLSSTSQSSSTMVNEATAMSYLQYQMTSMSYELVAMSSSVSSMNQQTGMNTLIAEAGLIVGILAVIAAIAVARRADAMYHDTSGQAAGSPPAQK